MYSSHTGSLQAFYFHRETVNFVPVLDLEKRVLDGAATLCIRCGAVLVGPHWTPPLSTPHSPVLAVCGMGAEACAKGRAIGDLDSISTLRQARAATSQSRSRTSRELLAMPFSFKMPTLPAGACSSISLENDILKTAAG